MRIAAILGLAGLLYHTQAVTVASQAPKNHTSETTVARLTVARANGDSFETFRRGEYRELLNKLAHQPDTTLQAISAYDSPIGIARATLKRLERDARVSGNNDTEPSTFEPYVMSAVIVLDNRTEKDVAVIVLRFVDSSSNNVFSMRMSSRPCDIWLEARKSKPVEVELMAMPYDPSNLTIQVAEVLFKDGDTWKPDLTGRSQSVSQRVVQSPEPVDTRPVMVNWTRPNYSEEARQWHVVGGARLRLRVGVNGIPSVIAILTKLPAGLTREAVLAALSMRFTPATRNGAPVPYDQVIEVEFDLR